MSPEPPQKNPLTAATMLAALMLFICAALLLDYIDRSTMLSSNPMGVLLRIRDLLVMVLFLLCAIVLGRKSLRILQHEPGPIPAETALALGVGFIWLYMIALLAAMLQIICAPVLWAVVLAPLLIFRRESFAVVRELTSWPIDHIQLKLFNVVVIALICLYGMAALVPPTFIDPLTYHLSIPAEYLAQGGVVSDRGNIFNSFPPAMSMLYLYLMGMGSDLLPKLLHAIFLVMIILVAHDQLRRHSSHRVARYTLLLFAAQWSVQHAVLRANIDFHFTFYAMTSFFLLIQPSGEDYKGTSSAGMPVLAGAFLGAAISCKLHAIASLGATELLLALLLTRKKVDLKGFLWFHLAAMAVYLPTLARNLIYTGDPIALFSAGIAKTIFGMEPFEIARFQAIAQFKGLFMAELSWKTFALTPLFMYLDGRYPSTNFDAFIDPFYLAALVFCLLFIRRHHLYQYLYIYIFGFYVIWLFTAGLTRYALPVLPLLCFLTVDGFDRLVRASRLRYKNALQKGFKYLIIIFSLVSGMQMVLENGSLLRHALSGFLEIVPRERFYANTGYDGMNTLPLGGYLDELDADRQPPPEPKSSKVFMVFASQNYYLGRPYYNDPFYVNLVLLQQYQQAGGDPLTWLKKRGYRYIVTDFHRIPWLLNPRKTNPLLNPYPDAIDRLMQVLNFWRNEIQPSLLYKKRFQRLELYEIP